jgi:hypothetical protein
MNRILANQGFIEFF